MISIPPVVARIPILRGLFRVALVGYARLTRGRFMVERRMGLSLLLDQDNAVDRGIFLTGVWEKRHVDTLLGLVEEERRFHGGEAVFLDIGAHWGLYALLARKTGMFRRIVAFEPDPTNYAQLQANLFLNGAESDIEALQLAASDSERTFGLYVRTLRNRGGTRVVEPGEAGQATCRAVRVDQALDIAGKLLVAKIDVESHELEALDGMAGLLARNHCVFQVEVWDYPEGERPRRLKILDELFGRYGMKCVRNIVDDYFYVTERAPAGHDS